MSCYHPLVGIFDGEYTENGKKKFKIQGGLLPHQVSEMHPGSVLIPCGHCIGCRLDYSRSWADRMMLELETAGKGVFLTVTYNNSHATPSMVSDYFPLEDEYFPQDGLVRLNGDKAYLCESFTLVKRDFQLFMKRLRRAFPDRKIRFYLGAEYGDSTFRPHGHFILFGLGLSDFSDLKEHGVNEFGQRYYTSPSLTHIWRNGFVLLSDVSWNTCAYVARYVTKKIGSFVLTRDYLNQLPEFALMSRKPGLGRSYLEQHPDCLDYQSINLSTAEGGLKIRVPKYFLKQLEKADPVRYIEIMESRKQFAEDKFLLELSNTELSALDYLEAKENEKLSRIKSLKRSL